MSGALAALFAHTPCRCERSSPHGVSSHDSFQQDTSLQPAASGLPYAEIPAAIKVNESCETSPEPAPLPQRVGLLCDNSEATYILILALMNLGVQMVMLNTRLSSAELSYHVADAQLTHILFSADAAAKAQALTDAPGSELRAIALEPLWEEVQASGDSSAASRTSQRCIRREFDLDEVMSILYTSGTTGQPKGVMQSYGNHLWSSIAGMLTSGITPHDAWVCAVPLFHISGLSILVRGLVYGIPVYLFQKFDAHALNGVLLSGKASIVSVVAYTLTKLLDDMERRPQHTYPDSFRYMLLGGGFFADSLLERCAHLHIPVIRSFGMSETCSQIIATPLRRDYYKPGSSGLPLFPNQLRIAAVHAARTKDDSAEDTPSTSLTPTDTAAHAASPAAVTSDPMRSNAACPTQGNATCAVRGDAACTAELPAGEIGEIQIKSPALCVGYVNKPDLYAAAFTHDGWYRTGDIGTLDDDGFLYVKSRLSDLIISGGENIYPTEVENVLAQHPAISEVAVVGHADDTWGYVPWAYIVPARPDALADEAATPVRNDTTRPADTAHSASTSTAPTPAAQTAISPPRPTDAELTAFVRSRLAAYKVPQRFIWLDALPKTSIGKIQKFKLLELPE
ncbi:MAG: AMP-binding protein [Actinomycetaceae bacterium]|nr:AMP-binding protein [Actinomycetaceae bacterium]